MSQIRPSTQLAPDGAAKGSLLVYNGSAWVPLAVGTNTQVLTANSAAPNGVDWEPAGAAAAPSFATLTKWGVD